MLRWLSVLALALALVAAGCGGGDDEASSESTVTVTETTDTDTTTETTTDEGSADQPDLSGALADEDCLALAGVGATIAQAYAGGAGSSDESTAELQALAEKVPDEIKADVQTLAQWYADYGAKLKDIGIEAGQTPSAQQLQELQSALASFDQEELTAASDRLSAWANENCTG